MHFLSFQETFIMLVFSQLLLKQNLSNFQGMIHVQISFYNIGPFSVLQENLNANWIFFHWGLY